MEDYKLEGILDLQLSRLSYPLTSIKDYIGTQTDHMEYMATRLDWLGNYVDGVKDQLGRLDTLEDISHSLHDLVDVQRNQTMAMENIAQALLVIAEALTK